MTKRLARKAGPCAQIWSTRYLGGGVCFLQARKAAERKGEPLPADAFDSNCITPGTSFMHRLGSHLRFFIRKKMETDATWQKPKIIFSGHDVPGEGEHKIMECIRWAKINSTYKPNLRHCMYGLDADLIMVRRR